MDVHRIRDRWLDVPEDAGPRITPEEAAAGARLAVRLFERWGLTDAEACVLLGGLAPRTWARWKTGEVGRIDADRAMRLSLLAGIHKGLRHLFTDPARVEGWITRPNADFDGERPLDVLLRGRITDLMDVRAYLDAARG
jgi:uncharacterized protein (DUF2384 family)